MDFEEMMEYWNEMTDLLNEKVPGILEAKIKLTEIEEIYSENYWESIEE